MRATRQSDIVDGRVVAGGTCMRDKVTWAASCMCRIWPSPRTAISNGGGPLLLGANEDPASKTPSGEGSGEAGACGCAGSSAACKYGVVASITDLSCSSSGGPPFRQSPFGLASHFGVSKRTVARAGRQRRRGRLSCTTVAGTRGCANPLRGARGRGDFDFIARFPTSARR